MRFRQTMRDSFLICSLLNNIYFPVYRADDEGPSI